MKWKFVYLWGEIMAESYQWLSDVIISILLKKGAILLRQTILETRRISHLYGSDFFIIPSRLISLKNKDCSGFVSLTMLLWCLPIMCETRADTPPLLDSLHTALYLPFGCCIIQLLNLLPDNHLSLKDQKTNHFLLIFHLCFRLGIHKHKEIRNLVWKLITEFLSSRQSL